MANKNNNLDGTVIACFVTFLIGAVCYFLPNAFANLISIFLLPVGGIALCLRLAVLTIARFMK